MQPSPLPLPRPTLAAARWALDTETPISALLKLRPAAEPTALLESVEQGAFTGRYSFLAIGAWARVQVFPTHMAVHTVQGTQRVTWSAQNPPVLAHLRRALQALQPHDADALPSPRPPFWGGLLGYWAYDMVRFFERLPQPPADDLGLPWADLFVPRLVLAFDHARREVLAVALAASRAAAQAQLDAAARRLTHPLPPAGEPASRPAAAPWRSTFTQTGFAHAVQRALDHIAAGDIFQVVLAQRLSRTTTAEPLAVYRALRRINPSPYMFFLDFPGDRPRRALVGASPEMLVRLHQGVAETNPIAGTRPRGATPEEDAALEAELRADEKEQAEHIMLVDLGRNDLGRVCEYGSVKVADLMRVERYSHVMHLVSRVVGRLRRDRDAWDLLAAAFPAGTVSGAPKVRAMQIIDALEPVARGPYAGAVGYVGFDGSLDTCITIRTVLFHGPQAYIQAGAGIVADSHPQREWEETLHKARAVARAVDQAEGLAAPFPQEVPDVVGHR